MGLYVEPNCSKDQWLRENGELISESQLINKESFWEECEKQECLPVVLILNMHETGYFFAAGVGFSKKEFAVFTDPNDRRLKAVFKVKKNILEPVCPDWKCYIK